MKRLWQIIDCLSGLELVVGGLIAAGLLIVGPISLFVHLYASSHFGTAIGLGLLYLGCLAACIYDLLRRRFTWPTRLIVATWFFTTLYVSLSLK